MSRAMIPPPTQPAHPVTEPDALAFPLDVPLRPGEREVHHGLTKREWMATMIMAGRPMTVEEAAQRADWLIDVLNNTRTRSKCPPR
jgi:hypothetical protein